MRNKKTKKDSLKTDKHNILYSAKEMKIYAELGFDTNTRKDEPTIDILKKIFGDSSKKSCESQSKSEGISKSDTVQEDEMEK